jgi:hypothetical protein
MIADNRTRALAKTEKKPDAQNNDEDQAQDAAINSKLIAAAPEAAPASVLEHAGAIPSVT